MELQNFLDKDGGINVWPKKHKAKRMILDHLATFFEREIIYSENEVNGIITKHHSFENIALLRRELIEKRILQRERDCSKYWKS